jgi:hypothetical protein
MRRWTNSGWLPALEATDWPRLARLRAEHEEAVASGDEGAVAEVVIRAATELRPALAEGERAWRASYAAIKAPEEPDPSGVIGGGRSALPVTIDEFTERGALAGVRAREHYTATAPVRRALGRDWDRLSALHAQLTSPSSSIRAEAMLVLDRARREPAEA